MNSPAFCFVIQPFDNGDFDDRFDQTFKPAIEAADTLAYRVDRDKGVEVPIDTIHEKIRNASVCLADITLDNPNVWYELGYAMAIGKPLVLICASDRATKFPFDIQHRTVVRYKTGTAKGFEDLKDAITDRVRLRKIQGDAVAQISQTETVAPIQGLSQPEISVLAAIASELTFPHDLASAYHVKNNVERLGTSSLGFNLGLRRLLVKGLVEVATGSNYNGEEFEALKVSATGWQWIDENEHALVLKEKQKPSRMHYTGPDSDPPF